MEKVKKINNVSYDDLTKLAKLIKEDVYKIFDESGFRFPGFEVLIKSFNNN